MTQAHPPHLTNHQSPRPWACLRFLEELPPGHSGWRIWGSVAKTWPRLVGMPFRPQKGRGFFLYCFILCKNPTSPTLNSAWAESLCPGARRWFQDWADFSRAPPLCSRAHSRWAGASVTHSHWDSVFPTADPPTTWSHGRCLSDPLRRSQHL